MSRNWLRPRDRKDEHGYVAILVAVLVMTIILPLCAISIDVARWYVEIERIQNAADAAALAGVTYLPDSLNDATTTARAAAARNGFPNSGTSTVTVALGSKPTQLKVTISSTVHNTFGAAIGRGSTTISRSAVADFNGPAPMGSPCNTFGNEPLAGSAEPLGTGSQIVQPAGGAVCSSNPQLWGAIAGPETDKRNGDAIMTRHCSSPDSGCTGTTNTQFNPLGYFYLVRVAQGAVSQPVTLQIYDPAFVETDDLCQDSPQNTSSPSGTNVRTNMNSYANTDGNTRYYWNEFANPPNAFCSGDKINGGTVAPTTSFALRGQTDTYRPSDGIPITGCTKQYKGFRRTDAVGVTSSRLREIRDAANGGGANASYSLDLAKVFHQWVTFCTFTPTVKGEYYLQIRTNVALPGSPVADGAGGYTGNTNVTSQTGDDGSVLGNGSNRFALRATGAARGSVSISGWEHMGIFANSQAASSTFNHVRVVPAAASKTLNIEFFDVGDASQAGTLKVLPPLESNLPGSAATPTQSLAGCTGVGVVTGNLTNCQLNNVSNASGFQGKKQVVRVPIPSTYTCTSTEVGGCWFRLRVAFPGGVSDITTWSARVEGDPVRLIE